MTPGELRIKGGGEKLSQAVRELVAAVCWGHHANALARVSDHAVRLYCLRAACVFTGLNVADHLADVGKMVDLGFRNQREADDILRMGRGPIAMTQTTMACWETRRTDETRHVEEVLRNAGFERADAYRYNAASIRVRVIDSRFEGLSPENRDGMVEPHLERLPERTQADIMNLFTFAPSELHQSPNSLREFMKNTEFEDPSPSML